jgi:hypothetical protein
MADFGCLVAIIQQIIAKMDSHHESMGANINAWWEGNKACREVTEACLQKTEAYLEAMEACPKKVKVETDADRKEMQACLEKTEACLERKERTSVEMANIAAHPEDSNEEVAVEMVRALKDQSGGPLSGRKMPRTAEKTDPGRWWVPAEDDRHPWTVDLPCHSCTAQGTQSSGTRQGQCCKKSP